MKPTLLIILIFCSLMLISSAGQGKIYRYANDQGITVFVNDESRIPTKYRPHVKSYPEQLDGFTPEQRQELWNREQQRRHEKYEARRSEQAERQRRTLIKSLETPVRIIGNQVLVPTQVAADRNQADVMLLLDTGASHTVFHRDSLAKLDIEAEKSGYSQVAGGGLIPTKLVRFQYMKVGPYQIDNLRAMVIDHKTTEVNFDGLLGMDFLPNLNYRIDYDRQIIRWQPELGE